MKIIKEGKLPSKVVWKGECHYCHTVIDADKEELKSVDPNYNTLDEYILCPLCERVIYCKVKVTR